MTEFVVVCNGRQRVVARGVGVTFNSVEVETVVDGKWQPEEPLYWDEDEWREQGTEAFEAILGVIAKVAEGEDVTADTKQYCEECGRQTRGNFALCTVCEKVLCDACDVRQPITPNEEPMCKEHRPPPVPEEPY